MPIAKSISSLASFALLASLASLPAPSARADDTDPAVQALKDSRWAQPEAQPKPAAGAPAAPKPKSTVTATCTDAAGKTLKEGESGYDSCLAQLSASATGDKRPKDTKDAKGSPTGAKPAAGFSFKVGH